MSKPGEKDIADIDTSKAPANWKPSVVDGNPSPADIVDKNEDASA